MSQKVRFVVVGSAVVVMGLAALFAAGAFDEPVAPATPLVASEPPTPTTTPTKTKTRDFSASRVLFGEVLGDNDAPVAGALVEGLVGDEGHAVREARTGVDGQFTLDDLPPMMRAVRFSAPGFAAVTVDVGALPTTDEAFWSQRLQATGVGVRVVVVAAEDQRPLAGVAVVGMRRVGSKQRPRFRKTELGRTDASGVVVVRAPANQTVVVVDPTRGALELERLDAGKQRVTLPAPAVVRGRVIDDQARPVKEATFTIARVGGLSTALGSALLQMHNGNERRPADDDGRFVFQTAAGTVSAQASGAGMRPGDAGEFTLVSGAATEIVVELAASPSVNGTVVDAETGDGIAACTVTPDGRADGARPAKTGVDGAFVLDSLVDRPSSVNVDCPGYARLAMGGLDGGRSRQAPLRIEMRKGKGDVVIGIGISLKRSRSAIRISRVQPGTPAARAGLRANEVIEAVDDVDVTARGAGLETAMALIRGQADTWVSLRVRGTNGRTREVELERQAIAVAAPNN